MTNGKEHWDLLCNHKPTGLKTLIKILLFEEQLSWS